MNTDTYIYDASGKRIGYTHYQRICNIWYFIGVNKLNIQRRKYPQTFKLIKEWGMPWGWV